VNRCVLSGWLTLFGAAIAAPVVLTVVCGSGDPATLWSALAVMTGSMALISLLFTLIVVSRIRRVTNRVGIDGVMHLHRILGTATVTLSVLHILAVVIDNPTNAWLLDPSIAPPRALAGTGALITLVLIVGFSEKKIRRYESWRWAHRLGSLLAIVLIVGHVWLLDRLIHVLPWALLFLTVAVVILAAGVWRWMAPARRRRFIVADIRSETPTVDTVTLSPLGDRLRHDAGQFAWLRLHAGPWSQDHPFTISSGADEETVELTYRHLGDWTTGPLRALRPGSVVWLDGPHGSMTLTSAQYAPGIIMIAAGVGLTPMISVLRTCADRGDPRPMHVITPPGEPLFRDELAYLTRVLDLTVTDTLPRAVTAVTLPPFFLDRAWVPEAAHFVAGPPDMVHDTCEALYALHVPPDRIRSERFMIA
jgi:predicted ferric reductase